MNFTDCQWYSPRFFWPGPVSTLVSHCVLLPTDTQSLYKRIRHWPLSNTITATTIMFLTCWSPVYTIILSCKGYENIHVLGRIYTIHSKGNFLNSKFSLQVISMMDIVYFQMAIVPVFFNKNFNDVIGSTFMKGNLTVKCLTLISICVFSVYQRTVRGLFLKYARSGDVTCFCARCGIFLRPVFYKLQLNAEMYITSVRACAVPPPDRKVPTAVWRHLQPDHV